ncbi:hypothetical protein GCM10009579_04870 [Streptomyces javensis]|uniref:Uncharacterized protein n=2 Tax=Streptomyces javensis TaxID=114698 RepID=A0ABN1WHG6_9ACTN
MREWSASAISLAARWWRRRPPVARISGTRLFPEIRERGCLGSRQVARKHLAAPRVGTAEPVRADLPSPRKTTSWITPPRDSLTGSQQEQPLSLRLACPDITRACDLARAFADPVRHRRGHLLQERIRQAEQGRCETGERIHRPPPPGPRHRPVRPHLPVVPELPKNT